MASVIKVDEIKSQANGSAISIASGGGITLNQANPTITLGSNATFPTKSANTGNTSAGGHVLQVQQKVKTTEFSTSTARHGVFTSVTGLDLKITPTSTSSKILITYHLCVASASGDHTGIATALRRGIDGTTPANLSGALGTSVSGIQAAVTTSTSHHSEDLNGSNPMHSMTYLDSPNTTDEIVYQPAIYNASGSDFVAHVNRNSNDSNHDYITKAISTITAMEIA